MTHLQGMWLGGSGPNSGRSRFAKSPEAGYPPFNIEALAEGDGASALRITPAVAGFSVEELAVTAEHGQLSSGRAGGGLYLPGHLRRGDSSEALPAAMSDAE